MEKQTTQELLLKIQELENKLKTLQKTKKYGLVFEEKPEIFEENSKNALPLLKEEKELEINNISNLSQKEIEPTNIIIEGDNYHTLSCLKYTHKNKIDVIYIDPPYNTGNKDFIYNDNYVDKEDSYRHSKWLSFMKKRLFLARDLLSEKGVIFISIDDNEFAQLKLLCDEIFREDNFLQDIIWQSRNSVSNDAIISLNHNHTLVYFKNKESIKDLLKYSYFTLDPDEKGYSNIDNDRRGPWKAIHIEISGVRISDGLLYEIIDEKGNTFTPKKGSCWRFSRDTFQNLVEENKIIFDYNGKNKPKYKQFFNDIVKTPISIWDDCGTTTSGTNDLKEIFNDKVFTNPKPKDLIIKILKLTTSINKSSIILDFFAGSGTTGHAVMELNRQDGGNRQFILCSNKEATTENPEKNICKNITYERNKRVILGYTNNKGEKIQGLGGKLKYYTTQFIKTESSIDDLRLKFINMCDDMLCIRENTFKKVDIEDILSISKNKNIENDFLKLYTNNSDFTVILYDVYYFDDLLKLVKTLNGKIKIYIFSIAKEIYEEELEIINNNIEIANIPDEILETYKKIFNF